MKTFASFILFYLFFFEKERRIGQCTSDGGQISPTIVAFVLNRILVLSITFKPRSSNTLSRNMLILSFVFVLPLVGLPDFFFLFFFYKTLCRRHRHTEDHCPPPHGEPHSLATDFAIQIFPRSLQEAYCLRECC